ncbi:MAG: dephospho-CoA kinase [Pseudomonadota bacterium]
MIVLGLTGSIGMGKSTTAAMFADAGVPVWDADAAVHALYGPGAAGSTAISQVAPEAVGPDGVDRAALRAAILADPGLLKTIEASIHPLVAQDRADFLAVQCEAGAKVVLCDIPLLFETGADAWLDRVVVVTAPAEVQRARVLERPGMTEEALAAILAKQVPDAEKQARADFIIDTSRGMDDARAQVAQVLEALDA